MKGLEFFKSQSSNEKDDFKYLESIMGFELPDMYKVFTSSYLLGEYNLLIPKIFDPKFNDASECASIVISLENPLQEYFFSGFFNSKELENDWESYSSTEIEFSEYGLLRIANLNIGGGIFLGITDDKKDKIYLVNWDSEDDYSLLADNIFEFSKNLTLLEDKSNMQDSVEYSQLYKSWGEDFWRVRK